MAALPDGSAMLLPVGRKPVLLAVLSLPRSNVSWYVVPGMVVMVCVTPSYGAPPRSPPANAALSARLRKYTPYGEDSGVALLSGIQFTAPLPVIVQPRMVVLLEVSVEPS